jgi:nitrate reductase gamma subunit
MSGLVLTVFYGSIGFCLIAYLIKLFRYITMPLPLRSDLYKGSSVYEQPSWWPRSGTSFKVKLMGTLKDILLQEGYYRHNRRFWYVLYPFHLGIYLLLLWHIWLFIFPQVAAGTGNLDYALIWGHTATGLIFIGAVGILIKRITDKKLRETYARLHYLKWALIILTLGSGIFVVQFYFSGSMIDLTAYVKQQLTFNIQDKLNPPLMASLHVLSVAAVLIYLPFSHPLRALLRYYYKMRWESVSGTAGGRVEKVTRGQLQYPVVWSAKHIPSMKTWKDL